MARTALPKKNDTQPFHPAANKNNNICLRSWTRALSWL